jgi:acyl-CoA synthetase (AMP-forming)/AMP-acid ligase II
MIKCSGFRISPTEVEDIAASIPGIREAVAFGVDEPALGQVVHLTVAIEDAELHPDEIIAACRKLMPSYMVPASIHLIGQSLPRTANGKLDRPRIIRESIEQLKQVN